MKIIETTDQKIVVDDFSWKVGSLFVGSALFLLLKMIQGSPQLTGDNFYGGVLSITLSLIFGLFWVWRKTFTFDRSTNSLIWEEKRATGSVRETIKFEDIESIVLQSNNIGSNSTVGYRAAIVKKDGGELPFSPAFSAGEREDYEKIVQEIQKFLSLKVLASDDMERANIEKMIADGDIINAIRALRDLEGISLSEAKQRVDQIRRNQDK